MKAILLLLIAGICFAQNPETKPAEQPKYYRVDFTVKETESGRTASSRNYGLTVPVSSKASIRTGDKVPVTTNKDGSFTYVDVGFNIDLIIEGSQNGLILLTISADMTNIASDKAAATPLINQTKVSSRLGVPLRKPTNIFSADATTTKRQMQMDVTVTPAPSAP